MSEMVERVARAMRIASYDFFRSPNLDEVDVDGMRKAMARAAIMAMREPTEGMVNAADPHGIIVANFEDAWHAMVDEALK